MRFLKYSIKKTMLLLLVCAAVNAQDTKIDFQHIPLGESIAVNEIHAIIQNKKGFIWFATSAGLCRFDGNETKFFKNSADDPNSLCSNRTTALLEDSRGIIWIGTDFGLSKFNPATEKFTNFRSSINALTSLSHNYINSICEDKDGGIWVGTKKGLNKLDVNKNVITKYYSLQKDSSSLSDNNVTVIYKDRENKIWIGTLDGLNRYDNSADSFINYKIKDIGDNSSISNEIRSIFEDSKGNMWIGTQRSFAKFDRVTGEFQAFDLHNYENGNLSRFSSNMSNELLIKSIVEDDNGRLWLSSQYGLINFTPDSEKLINYKIFKNHSSNALPNYISSLYIDKNSTLWLGMYGKGLYLCSTKVNKFTRYSTAGNPEIKITAKSIRAINEIGNDKIIVGGYFGLNIIDRKRNEVKTYLKDEAIYSILQDPDDPQNVFWIGKDVGGLCKFNLQTGDYTQYKYEKPNLIKGEIISSLFIGSKGKLWIGTELGINRFDRFSETSDFLGYRHGKKFSLSGSRVNDIFEDESNHIWLATNGGIDIINLAKGKIKKLVNRPEDKFSLSYNNVLSIYKDKSGYLWFGTDGGGLNRYDEKTEKIKRYSKKDGLPDDVIYGILEDAEENLWLSTNRGISRFNIADESFVNFDKSSGLLDLEFNRNAYFKSKSGELFFGGISGLISFLPGDVSFSQTSPKVFLTSLELRNEKINIGDLRYGKAILNKDISYTDSVVVSYEDNFINLSYSCVEIADLSKALYSYKMEGIDDKWNYVGHRRYASYSSLPPGEYDFFVRAKGLNNKWSDPASLSIIITPPYWRTYWFYLLMISLISAIIVLIYRFRINHIYEIERIRVKLASDIHDDIGATLSKISMIAEILKNKIEPETTDEKLTRISELSGKAIESMHDIVWTIDSRNDSFETIIIKIKDETYSLLRSKNIEVKFDIDFDEKKKSLSLIVKQNLYLIVKEAVNNIYKHSDADIVDIKFKLSGSSLTLKIHDNGRIFKNNSFSAGSGLKNMKMRAESIGGKLTFNNQNGFTILVEEIKI